METWIIILISVTCISLVFIYFQFKGTKFNKLVAGLARSAKIDFKVYGQLTKAEEKHLSQYSGLIINMLKNSATMSKSVDIKLMPRQGKIDCEINFLGKLAIGQNLIDSSSKKFNNTFGILRASIEKNGGEVIVINQFNHKGEPVSSGLQFSI